MKKSLLLITALISLGATAQNINDQKVSFGYIQLPSQPIDKSIKSYSVVIDNSFYTKSNEDSLAAYKVRLAEYEKNYENWLEEKKKVDKVHYMNLAAWERKVNAGDAAAQMPVKPPYPEQPIKEEVRLPLLTNEITDANTGNLALEGYTKGNGGVVITITPMGFQEAKIDVKKAGTGPTTKYTYTSSCKMPVKVKVEAPGKGVIMDEEINAGAQTSVIKAYDNQYEHQAWLIDNYDSFWEGKQNAMLSSAMANINQMINDRFGFPNKTWATEIYTVKKHKGHKYSDLIDAYSNAKSGYDMLSNGTDKTQASKKINKAISIWEKALGESNLNDNKSRINKKVTGVIYANLAEAYMWKDDFDKADNYAQKAILSGVSKAKSQGKRLQPAINGLKTRYQANH